MSVIADFELLNNLIKYGTLAFNINLLTFFLFFIIIINFLNSFQLKRNIFSVFVIAITDADAVIEPVIVSSV